MAQALMNNLNIIKDTSYGITEKNTEDSIKDFAAILKANSESINENKNEKIEQNSTPNTENVCTILDTKTNQNVSEEDTISAIMKDVILEAAIETVVDSNMAGSDTLINVNIENSDNSENNNGISDDEIQNNENNNAITTNENEDPTMYEKLNAPENPTAAILLQSQTITDNHTIRLSDINTEDNLLSTDETKSKSVLSLNSKQYENLSKFEVPAEKYEQSEIQSQKLESKIDEHIVKELHAEVTESETFAASENGFEDFMNNQSPQEQTIKVMLQGDVEQKTSFENVVKFENLKQESVTPSKIIEQIAKQMENLNNGSRLNMILNPESLGKINLQILNSKSGLIANFTVSTPEAKELLLKGIDGLKESLLAQGINVDSVNVEIEEASDSDTQYDWTEQQGSRGGFKHQGSRKKKEEEQQFEQMMFEVNNG